MLELICNGARFGPQDTNALKSLALPYELMSDPVVPIPFVSRLCKTRNRESEPRRVISSANFLSLSVLFDSSQNHPICSHFLRPSASNFRADKLVSNRFREFSEFSKIFDILNRSFEVYSNIICNLFSLERGKKLL